MKKKCYVFENTRNMAFSGVKIKSFLMKFRIFSHNASVSCINIYLFKHQSKDTGGDKIFVFSFFLFFFLCFETILKVDGMN